MQKNLHDVYVDLRECVAPTYHSLPDHYEWIPLWNENN